MKTCHKMKVYRHWDQKRVKPEIRLFGYWLEKIGFPAGSEISVTILDNRILIERDMRDEAGLDDLVNYFEAEGKKELKEKDLILKWVREHGGIKANTVSGDVRALTQKESGYKGRSSIVRANGQALDTLCQEARWEGMVSEGTTTDEFGDMIKSRVEG